MALVTNRSNLGDERFSHAAIADTISQKSQQLIILPTEKCNFRCTYCYEDFQIGKMKEPVQASIERFMDQRIPELSKFSIQWFGGEPLVAKSVVLRLASHADRLCERFGVLFEGALTTNGYLLNADLFEELVAYKQRFFQITLDGWEEHHNAVRKLANGGGSFDRIWANLIATKALRADFSIQIRIHVRRDNYDSVKMLVAKLAEAFGDDSRYTMDFQHLRDLGGEGGKTVERPLSYAEVRALEVGLRADYAAIAAELRARRRAAQGPEGATGPVGAPGPVDASEEGPEQRPAEDDPYICYAAKPNSLLIRADGRIGKCTVALTDNRNTIGAINPDGTVTIDNGLLRPWIRGLSSLDPHALACPLEGMAKLQVPAS